MYQGECEQGRTEWCHFVRICSKMSLSSCADVFSLIVSIITKHRIPNLKEILFIYFFFQKMYVTV